MRAALFVLQHLTFISSRYDGDRDHIIPIPGRESRLSSRRQASGGKYEALPWAERRSRLVDALLSMGELDVVGFQVSQGTLTGPARTGRL